MNISYFKFDVDDVTGELDSNRPVPFRMTPNIVEFVTSIGKYLHVYLLYTFTAGFIATTNLYIL